MSNGLQFDEEISRKVESLYLTPDVIAQRGQVLKALALRKGERVLDIGSGPGLLTYDMAASVGREYRENTYGKCLLAIMATFAVGRKGVSREEADAWLTEFDELDKQGTFFFSLNRYLFVADKPATTG